MTECGEKVINKKLVFGLNAVVYRHTGAPYPAPIPRQRPQGIISFRGPKPLFRHEKTGNQRKLNAGFFSSAVRSSYPLRLLARFPIRGTIHVRRRNRI